MTGVSNPYAVRGATITGYFYLNVSTINRGSRTTAQWATAITQAVNQNPEGILARFNGHTIVIMGSSYGQTASTYSLNENTLETTPKENTEPALDWVLLTQENQYLYSGEYDDILGNMMIFSNQILSNPKILKMHHINRWPKMQVLTVVL
ncbi:MAG: hypothetical protein PHH84_08805 [Oscillospiraceae bacterium]|nr:hypothetical protein [Oscillospiraceae bacterium]MDD4414416.1 hypothetical protein [Oscillospiraceae bacterium]